MSTNITKSATDVFADVATLRASGGSAEIFRIKLDSDNYQRALPLLSLAGIHLEQNQPSAAEAAAREALDLFTTALPEGHPLTASAECRLGQSLLAQGRPQEAKPLIEHSAGPLRETEEFPEYRDECLSVANEMGL